MEAHIGIDFSPADRSLLGVSFGGLNAAYFAAKSKHFRNYALLSPITYPCEDLHALIAFSTAENLRLFISTGNNDAEAYARPLAALFRSNGHSVQYHATTGGHDFGNWKEQMVLMMNFLFQEPIQADRRKFLK